MTWKQAIIKFHKLKYTDSRRLIFVKKWFFFCFYGHPPHGCHLPLTGISVSDISVSDLQYFGPWWSTRIKFKGEEEEQALFSRYPEYKKFISYRLTGKKELNLDDDQTWISLSSRARNTIRRSIKLGLHAENAKLSDNTSFVYRLVNETAKRKGYSNTFSRSFVSFLGKRMDSEAYLLLKGIKNQRDIAFLLFLIDDDEAIYYQGGTEYHSLKTGVSSLLMYEAFKSLAARGVKTLDLNGVDDPGVGKWKMSFGLDRHQEIIFERLSPILAFVIRVRNWFLV
jgi:lipid II:glycine glycyltransferase (peptidoglycan interpeptide bridge formation enzyme)